MIAKQIAGRVLEALECLMKIAQACSLMIANEIEDWVWEALEYFMKIAQAA